MDTVEKLHGRVCEEGGTVRCVEKQNEVVDGVMGEFLWRQKKQTQTHARIPPLSSLPPPSHTYPQPVVTE